MQSKKNFYEVLGVSKSASQDEIKSAYKKLSLKHHPDRNQNDPSAKQRFAEISEAYQVLSDPKQRQAYDFTGHQGAGGFGGGFEGFDFGGFGGGFGDFGDAEDIFSSFFGGGRKKQQQGQTRINGEDINIALSISLEEAFTGKQVSLEYFKMNRCDTCSGSGTKEGPKHKCAYCNGTGYVTINAILTVIRQTCPECNGSKYTSKTTCSDCNGKRRKKVKVVEQINIPQGIDNNQNLIINGGGDSGINASNGNLIINVKIREHPIFRRDKGDLYMTRTVPSSKMALGGEILVQSLVGPEFTIGIPEGSAVNARLRASGKGMKYYNSDSRGNLFIDLIPEIPNPSKMTDDVRAAWNTIYEDENKTPPPVKKKFGFF